MSRVLIIGGHGKVARLAEPLLAAAGHEVAAVVRDKAQFADVVAAGATPVLADIASLDGAGWRRLLAGFDVIVWSAGAGGGSAERTYAIDRDAAIASIGAAEAAGVPRYVMVSYFGAGFDHGVDPENSFFAYAEAKAAADEVLRGSPLGWCILAPSTLTSDAATGRIDTSAATGTHVARGDVAAVIAAVVDEPGAVRLTVRFNEGQVPVAQAIAEAVAAG